MSNIYTLASPTPTLYIFPSQVHPVAPVIPPVGGGRGVRRYVQPPHDPDPKRRRDEVSLAVLGAI